VTIVYIDHVRHPVAVHTAYCALQIVQVVNVWNRLPAQIDFGSLCSFSRTVKEVDLSEFLMCF